MSAYLLVEGQRTEMILYPEWISHLVPDMKRIYSLGDAKDGEKSYFIFSGLGMPNLLQRALPSSAEDVLKNSGFNELVVIIDSEGKNPADLNNAVHAVLADYKPGHAIDLTVIIQDVCIETWLLGNKRMYGGGIQCSVLRSYRSFCDLKVRDPESLRSIAPGNERFNLAGFHEDYLKRLFREKNESYSKRKPGIAVGRSYLNELMTRFSQGHLSSFHAFLSWCDKYR